MKPGKSISVFTALNAAVVAALAASAPTHAEVYSNNIEPRADDRAATRQALTAAQEAEDSLQQENGTQRVQQPGSTVYIEHPVTAPESVPAAAPAPAPVATADASADANTPRAELTRRQRIREEIKNEDSLQTRLEELRLRDEQRRTQQILNSTPNAQPVAAAPAADLGTAPNSMIQEQPIVSPTAQQQGAAPRGTAPASAPVAESAAGATVVAEGGDQEDKTTVSLQPRIGAGNMVGTNGYNVDARFSTGIGLEMSVSDNLSVEAGYQYAEYGIGLGSLNPFAAGYSYGGYTQDTMTLKQNIFDAGLKFHLTGPDSRLRPFVGAGLGYGRSYINYDQAALGLMAGDSYLNGLGSDYSLNQFLGYLEAGLDVRVAKNISVGIVGKYYGVLSSSQNQPLNNLAFYGPGGGAYGPMGGGYQPVNYNQQMVGGSLAGNGFYSLMGNVTFSF